MRQNRREKSRRMKGSAMRLKGKTAIVTGAGSGIGKALAARLAQDGADIVVADLRNHDEAAAEIAKTGARALGVRADVSSEADVARMTEEAIRAFGRIDILVNNAAMFSVIHVQPFEGISAQEWKRVMEVNTLGVFLCCRAVVPHMRKQGGGRIINLASGTVFKGTPFFLHYVTSKGAVVALTRALAREVGKDNITVNALAPGLTLSEGVLSHREHVDPVREALLKSRSIQRDEYPEDLVGAVSFLASADAAFMTGQTLVVDGGSAMH